MAAGSFNWKKVRAVLLLAVYMLFAAFLQSLLFSRVSIFGVKGFLLPAAAVAAGMHLGGVRGAVFGLILGVLSDMFFPETTVLYTFLFPLIGFGTGAAAEFYMNRGYFPFLISTAAALLVTGFMQLLLAVVINGAGFFSALLTVILQTAVSLIPSALLYVPFARRQRKDRQ